MTLSPFPAVPPHPMLPAYYASREERSAFVRLLFNRVAGEYDEVNAIFSLGSGRWYRRQTLRRAGLRTGMRVLDVATGTGLVAREARSLAGATGGVVGLDLSESMLADILVRLIRMNAITMASGMVTATTRALRQLPRNMINTMQTRPMPSSTVWATLLMVAWTRFSRSI